MGQDASKVHQEGAKTIDDMKEHVDAANEMLARFRDRSGNVFRCELELKTKDVGPFFTWRHYVAVHVRKNGRKGDCVHVKTLGYKEFYLILEQLQQLDGDDLPRRRKRRTKSSNLTNSESECVICMERKSDEVLMCAHAFCAPCLTEWRQQSSSCPMCRDTNIDHEDSFVLSSSPSREELYDFVAQLVESMQPKE